MKCYNPITTTKHTDLPCGKCFACKLTRISDWCTRLHFEEMYSHSSYFITLTYNYANLKFTSARARQANAATLYKRDVQLFLKRLRKADAKNRSAANRRTHPIKFISAGEYGTRNKRPHYHLLIFNATQDGILNAWKRGDSSMGHVHFGQVNTTTIGYTVGYIAEAAARRTDVRISHYGLQLPFLTYSKGLGAAYITASSVRYHTASQNLIHRCYVMVDGKKKHMPRYYRNRIYSAQAFNQVKKHLADLELQKAPKQVEITHPRNLRIFNSRMLEAYRKETVH
ncbi:MAG: replication initiator protein [Microviridae sp.]|nr:MAG: replication initiator protein [Microviridae sp.]